MSPAQDTRAFHADALADLAGALAFVDAACVAAGRDEMERHDLRLAMEEVFTNVYRHGYAGGAGGLELRVETGSDASTLVLLDRAALFDPASVATPSLTLAPEDREPGGLGWHLVRQLMDEVRHAARPGGGNIYTLVRARRGAGGPD